MKILHIYETISKSVHAYTLAICSSDVSNPEEKTGQPYIKEDELRRALAVEGNVIKNAIDNIMSK